MFILLAILFGNLLCSYGFSMNWASSGTFPEVMVHDEKRKNRARKLCQVTGSFSSRFCIGSMPLGRFFKLASVCTQQDRDLLRLHVLQPCYIKSESYNRPFRNNRVGLAHQYGTRR
ncbi:hypothetical protein BD408DRAFT_49802 [Parasitella parasitica]|nr:hypothetical protein BD408DRAFT_49802 [Parasitella parasitica]